MSISSQRLRSFVLFFQSQKWLGITLKVGFAAGLIYWLVGKGFLDLGEVFERASWGQMALGLILTLGAITFNHWRWVTLVQGVEISATVKSLFPLTFMGLFFNYAMPGSVGGDLIKGYYIVRSNPQKKMAAGFSVLMDRLVGFWAMSFLALTALLLKWSLVRETRELQLMATAIAAIFLGFTFFFLAARFFRDLDEKSMPGRLSEQALVKVFFKVFRAFQAYQKTPKVILYSFILSLIAQLFAISFMVLIGEVLAETRLDLTSYFFIVPLGFIATALPVAPAGIGVGQAALFFLFNIVIGEKTQLGPNAITSFQISLFLWSLLGAYYYVRHKPSTSEVLNAG